MRNKTIFAELAGRKIDAWDLSSDGQKLTLWIEKPGREKTRDDWFKTQADVCDKVELKTYGDCCSQTWIEAIDDPDALCGVVLEVEDVEMPESVQRVTPLCQDPDCVQFYGLRVTTSAGRCVIEYRNNSNGYYGGSLELS